VVPKWTPFRDVFRASRLCDRPKREMPFGPAPLPETLIARSVEFWLEQKFGKAAPGAITGEAFAEYLRCYRNPAAIHASCEDYRAGASIDLADDEADMERKVVCPLLALWGERAPMHSLYDVAATWSARAMNVTGKALPGTHYFPEEIPDAVANELREFFKVGGPEGPPLRSNQP
jgi:haloacetate dehalogenase